MTVHDRRHLSLAQWNAQEAIMRAAAGDEETADYHLAAAVEVARLVPGVRLPQFPTPDDVMAATLAVA